MLSLVTAIALAGVVEFTEVETIAVDDTVVTQTTVVLWPERPSGPLTEADISAVARELGVEPEVIHAVIDIEAGRAHQGFWTEGKPIVNFTLSLFAKGCSRHGTTYSQKEHPTLFATAKRKKHGLQQSAVQARIDDAMTIDSVAAIEATYWGMFQIGGFNWRRCGCSSPQDFLRRMSLSEREQLVLFARFVEADPKMLDALRRKDWSRFARSYNGSSYARRGYHTRLAAAYKRWKGK